VQPKKTPPTFQDDICRELFFWQLPEVPGIASYGKLSQQCRRVFVFNRHRLCHPDLVWLLPLCEGSKIQDKTLATALQTHRIVGCGKMIFNHCLVMCPLIRMHWQLLWPTKPPPFALNQRTTTGMIRCASGSLFITSFQLDCFSSLFQILLGSLAVQSLL